MMTFVAIVHILVAIILIGLVLIQDSKGGGALGIGGGGAGSNSLLGATGAQTLAAKMTRIVAVIFALTCISLTVMTADRSGSVVDGMIPASSPAKDVAPTEAAPSEQAPAPGAVQPDAPVTEPAGN